MVKAIIISGYGINCEEESAHAFEKAGAEATIVHINDLISGKEKLSMYDILMFPGGFSYGDDTGSGNALANKIRNHLWNDLMSFIQAKKLILGVCNGFQVMTNLGLFSLPPGKRMTALLPNTQERYECRWVEVKKKSNTCVFTKGMETTFLPIAHGEGRFFCDEETLKTLEEQNQIVFQYSSDGEVAPSFPANPNGSLKSIAAICDPTGRIMGMMPHPERALYTINRPDFHELKDAAAREGTTLPEEQASNLALFKNAVAYFSAKKEAHPYKTVLREHLKNTLPSAFIPELGTHRAGKVREVHEREGVLTMIASDRVSSFDHILPNLIPCKGRVLNMLSQWSLEQTQDIVANASLPSPHPNVLVQKKFKNIGVECVVRGYVWGSMANAYEEGKRVFCGVDLPTGLLRYEKLPEPLFTPTTKEGHDRAMTMEEVKEKLGEKVAEEVKEKSIALYKRGAEIAQQQGLVLIDTKYEFGVDEANNLFLIDEANTPDSSRYCSAEEYEKVKKIKQEVIAGSYKNVSELIEQRPELKIEERSKQFVRDVLVGKGFSYGSEGAIPELTDEEVIEVAFRYIQLYEQLTGRKFLFPDDDVTKDLLQSLKKKGYVRGAAVATLTLDAIQPEIDVPVVSVETVEQANTSLEPLVLVVSEQFAHVEKESTHPVVIMKEGWERRVKQILRHSLPDITL